MRMVGSNSVPLDYKSCPLPLDHNYNILKVKNIPSKLLTSTVTPNFDMVSQKIVKILGAQQFKRGNFSQELFSLKYFL